MTDQMFDVKLSKFYHADGYNILLNTVFHMMLLEVSPCRCSNLRTCGWDVSKNRQMVLIRLETSQEVDIT